MKNLFTLSVMALLVLSAVPMVLAVSVGSGVGVDILTEDFEPKVWLCDDRVVLDDDVEPGRTCPIEEEKWNGETQSFEGAECDWSQDVSSYTVDGKLLPERLHNYAFEGEKIVWDVIVFDKNGIEKIEDVFAKINSDSRGEGGDIEVNCILDEIISDNQVQDETGEDGIAEDQDGTLQDNEVWEECNARIGEEYIKQFKDNTAAKYKCILTVETPESMYGEHWITVEATDLDGLSGTMDENEYWFLNPEIFLKIEGFLTFDDVRPGASSYSETLLVGNDADDGSGVMLDMFISGTDFYDSASSGAKCPLTNQLKLGDGDSECEVGDDFGGSGDWTDPFCYFATQGSYSSQGDWRNDEVEDYVGVRYGVGFNDPNPFYGYFNGDAGGYEIIQSDTRIGPYFAGNILSPGSEMALTFRLNLPEPCNGDFDTGSIFFWGEAI